MNHKLMSMIKLTIDIQLLLNGDALSFVAKSTQTFV